MTPDAVLALVRDFFVAPAGQARRPRVAPVPPVAIILGGPRSVPALAAATALALARGHGSAHAVSALWCPIDPPAPRCPATGPARRTASRLAARDCRVEITGRLVLGRLPDPPDQAAVDAQRIVGAADCPVAVGLAGPRSADLDVLLMLGDVVVLARRRGDAPSLARLAEAGLARLGIPVVTCDAHTGPAGRWLALAGLAPGRPVRDALAPALGA